MEVIFSAVMNELVSRSISFLVDIYLKQKAAPTKEERLRSLQRLLLRLRVIADEADGRLITNQAMLHQLSILKKEMYKGYYTLDVFGCRAHGEDVKKDRKVHYFFAHSEFNPAKRVCFCNEDASQAELLEQVLGSIRDIIEDMSEFVMLLCKSPRLNRQPYNMYLLLGKCMFGRQMEMEHIINFLLQAERAPDAAENPPVLPIIGPMGVGKSTLIEHACDNERVRNHFYQILCFSDDDLKGATLEILRDRGRIKHQNRGMGGGRTLIVVELLSDIERNVWKRLYSAARSHIGSGSKIIIASRSDMIARFGTTQPIRLQCLSQEAYWYFFKVCTFGSTNSEDHPKLTAVAMDMARLLNGCFMGAAIFTGLLKANFNICFWNMALSIIRNINQKQVLMYGVAEPWQLAEPVYVRRANKTSSEWFVIFADSQTSSAETEAEDPETISVHDFYFGNVRPRGNFKVHAWTSHLPPHYNYMFHCRIEALPEE
ncbi:putative disease resistance protein RGA3 [Lolium rigidum]|uniref:putative disease resistance protein RGA3 n=1 Tax=Lolium rigidum TaxID=89674 RepID=UPI001F5CD01F|nr:putative disease resistance protein RGA3 [Lolium rigidum]